MRQIGYCLALVLLIVPFVGCAAPRPASSTYEVAADGTVAVGTRSALNGSTAPGRQEILGLYLPFPPFAVKAGLEYDGTLPIIIGQPPAPQVAPQAVAPCVTETFRTETYTEMVPVQRTRQVPVKQVTLPIPQAAPGCAPPPAPPVAMQDPAVCEAPAWVTAHAAGK
jgi:hypothetical protein